MNWDQIKAIQSHGADLRLILPFGLNLKLGDVVSIGKDGGFTLQGSCASLLGVNCGSVRPAALAGVSLSIQDAKKTSVAFRAAGVASAEFPNAPHASAGFDVSFGSADGRTLAFLDRRLTVLENVHRFKDPILTAHKAGVWQPDWALITGVSVVQQMTLLASKSSGTKVALSISGNVPVDAPVEVKLTAGVSITACNQQLIQCIVSDPITAFCAGLRLHGSLFGHRVGVLGLAEVGTWVDMDTGIAPSVDESA